MKLFHLLIRRIWSGLAAVVLGLSLLAVFLPSAQAHSSSTLRESLQLYSNKDVYMPGEILWFTVYTNPDHASNMQDEQAVYVELWSEAGEQVWNARLALKSAFQTQGSLFLPASLKSGDYWLMAYTKDADASSSLDITQRAIRILNPAEESFWKVLNQPRPRQTHAWEQADTLRLALSLPAGNEWGVRETGTLRIGSSVIGHPGVFSVSIYQQSHPQLAGIGEREVALAYDKLPDWEDDGLRSIRIQIQQPNSDQPRAHAYFYLAFPGTTERLYVSRTDAQGVAEFVVDPVYGKQTAVLVSEDRQPFDMKLLSHALRMVRVSGEMPESQEPVGDSAFDSALVESLEAQYIHVQAENVYFRRERAVFDDSLARYKAPFYGQPDRTYLLDDYTRFVLMEEVLREYMPDVSVVRQSGRFELRVHDLRSNLFFDQSPLILLDGVPVHDAGLLIAYDPLNIKEISVVRSKVYYGTKEFHGLVSFKTYDGDMKDFGFDRSALIFDYEGFQLPRRFFSPDYGKEGGQYPDRIPDFRQVLLWEGSVQSSGTEDVELRFSTSDLKGPFVMEVHGMDVRGRVWQGRSTFHVR